MEYDRSNPKLGSIWIEVEEINGRYMFKAAYMFIKIEDDKKGWEEFLVEDEYKKGLQMDIDITLNKKLYFKEKELNGMDLG